ncbi:putative transcription regulator Homeodomain-LIKE family [Helianthus annuus]|nr:putative transcription regulator Homeodomain-LIKE family [Helianthus annuus]
MLAFSERLGWRIQKHDEAVVQQFCAELVLKDMFLRFGCIITSTQLVRNPNFSIHWLMLKSWNFNMCDLKLINGMLVWTNY